MLVFKTNFIGSSPVVSVMLNINSVIDLILNYIYIPQGIGSKFNDIIRIPSRQCLFGFDIKIPKNQEHTRSYMDILMDEILYRKTCSGLWKYTFLTYLAYVLHNRTRLVENFRNRPVGRGWRITTGNIFFKTIANIGSAIINVILSGIKGIKNFISDKLKKKKNKELEEQSDKILSKAEKVIKLLSDKYYLLKNLIKGVMDNSFNSIILDTIKIKIKIFLKKINNYYTCFIFFFNNLKYLYFYNNNVYKIFKYINLFIFIYKLKKKIISFIIKFIIFLLIIIKKIIIFIYNLLNNIYKIYDNIDSNLWYYLFSIFIFIHYIIELFMYKYQRLWLVLYCIYFNFDTKINFFLIIFLKIFITIVSFFIFKKIFVKIFPIILWVIRELFIYIDLNKNYFFFTLFNVLIDFIFDKHLRILPIIYYIYLSYTYEINYILKVILIYFFVLNLFFYFFKKILLICNIIFKKMILIFYNIYKKILLINSVFLKKKNIWKFNFNSLLLFLYSKYYVYLKDIKTKHNNKLEENTFLSKKFNNWNLHNKFKKGYRDNHNKKL